MDGCKKVRAVAGLDKVNGGKWVVLFLVRYKLVLVNMVSLWEVPFSTWL